MFLSNWSIIFGVIALVAGVLWFFLRHQIKTEELGRRVEPNLDHPEGEEFSVFGTRNPYTKKNFAAQNHNQVEHDKAETLYPKPNYIIDEVAESYDFDLNIEEHKDIFGNVFTKDDLEEVFEAPKHGASEKISEQSIKRSPNLDLFEEGINHHEDNQQESNRLINKFRGFFKKHPRHLPDPKEAIASLSAPENRAMARPAPVRTVALILKAPEDQPYLGQEVLEVGSEMNLMVGKEGFLEHMTTTYFGDEPMYSIAHMIHPGSFNESGIINKELPGLVFFAHIPGPDPDMDTIDYLIKAAAKFGQELGGTLLNEYQEPVDRDYLAALYKEISVLDKKTWSDMLAYQP